MAAGWAEQAARKIDTNQSINTFPFFIQASSSCAKMHNSIILLIRAESSLAAGDIFFDVSQVTAHGEGCELPKQMGTAKYHVNNHRNLVRLVFPKHAIFVETEKMSMIIGQLDATLALNWQQGPVEK